MGVSETQCSLSDLDSYVYFLQFEEYERAWDSDPEEEAFVDSLALKLLEDAADGPVDLDDEDPDFDDWGGMDADDDDKHTSSEYDYEDVSEEIADEEESDDNENEENADDKDAFMDDVDSDASGDSDGEGDLSVDEDGVHASNRKIFSHQGNDEGECSSFDDEGDLAIGVDDGVDESTSEEEPRSRKKARKMDLLPTFADADDYADMINKDFTNLVQGSRKKPKQTTRGK